MTHVVAKDTNIVAQASSPNEYKLLKRDEKKEAKALREVLLKLSTFQVRFVEQYIRTASASHAARLAGSKSGNPEIVGYKLLQNPTVQQAIALAMRKRIEAVGLDSIEVIQKIRAIYDVAMENGKYADANKACELLQKEIERASKKPTIDQTPEFYKGASSKNLPVPHEDLIEHGVNIDEDLEKVISIISSKPTLIANAS